MAKPKETPFNSLELLTMGGAGRESGMSHDWLRIQERRGRLHPIRPIGSRLRLFNRRELLALLADRAAQHASAS